MFKWHWSKQNLHSNFDGWMKSTCEHILLQISEYALLPLVSHLALPCWVLIRYITLDSRIQTHKYIPCELQKKKASTQTMCHDSVWTPANVLGTWMVQTRPSLDLPSNNAPIAQCGDYQSGLVLGIQYRHSVLRLRGTGMGECGLLLSTSSTSSLCKHILTENAASSSCHLPAHLSPAQRFIYDDRISDQWLLSFLPQRRNIWTRHSFSNK